MHNLFQAGGSSHLTALLVTALAYLALWRWAGTRCQQLLGWYLLLQWPICTALRATAGVLDDQQSLPLHLCDLASLSGGVALLWQRQPAAELCYFFGMAGTMQGLITPALQLDFPHVEYFVFFALHSSVVITALYLVTATPLTPRPGAIGRVTGALLLYAVLVGGLNALLQTNYGFLCAPPPTASLIDLLGPWPWYLCSVFVIAVFFFFLLDLPFRFMRRRRSLDQSSAVHSTPSS
jgi:hypothetical integral membrane protein (TIGR02206 family)